MVTLKSKNPEIIIEERGYKRKLQPKKKIQKYKSREKIRTRSKEESLRIRKIIKITKQNP